jgi:hypothetical protein
LVAAGVVAGFTVSVCVQVAPANPNIKATSSRNSDRVRGMRILS